MRTKFINVNGVMTRYVTAGDKDKPTIILVHGRILTAEHWFRNIDALGEDFYVIAPDILGNGFSGPVDFSQGAHPVEQRVDHLLGLVDALELDSFYACGSSHGALLSALLHFRIPDRLTKLVINGSAAFASPELLADGVDETLRRDDPRIGNLSLDEWHNWMSDYVYDDSCLPPEIFPVVMTAYAQNWVMDSWRKSLLGHKQMHVREDLTIGHRLSKITAETLLVWGRDDIGAPLGDAEKMVGEIPNSRLIIFDKCRHMPMMEYPDRFNQLVRDFLKNGVAAAA